MHKLSRKVRFSINPFLTDVSIGENSFCAKPAGEGLAIFLELIISLAGAADSDTGFVVNVVDIDACARETVVPIISDQIKQRYRLGQHIDFKQLVYFLELAQGQLRGKFGRTVTADIALMLNPNRRIAIDCEEKKMAYYSEKFEFAAMHKLWNDKFSDEKNLEVFGKCANKAGHGHNYIIEVTVKTPRNGDFGYGEFEKIVDDNLISLIDHKNLNTDIAGFNENPTVENIAVFAWGKLAGKVAGLFSVTVWETDKTSCTYYGP